jgi:DNA-directed RNA polymerase specialized sigma24 family protein
MAKYVATQMQKPEDPREGLEAVVALRRLLEMVEAAQVENAYVAGWSWARIAEVLGVSRQAVHKKHAKRLRAKFAGEGSGEGGAGR